MARRRDRSQPSELLDQVPPNNHDAERALVGSVILDNRVLSEVLDVRPADFHNAMYGILWGRLLAMAKAGIPLEAVTIPAALRAAGEWDDGGDEMPQRVVVTAVDLAECCQAVPVAVHARYYAGLVLEASFRRRMIHAIVVLLRRAFDPTVSVERLRGMAGSLLAKISKAAKEER